MTTPTPEEVAKKLAMRFHETYERLATSYGYETRKESAVAWEDVPDRNKRLMIAVCAELLATSPLLEYEQLRRAVEQFNANHAFPVAGHEVLKSLAALNTALREKGI